MPPIIYGRVGDEKMQTITVKISRRDEIPDLSGGVITFEGEPAGGKVKVFDSENVSSNSVGLQKGTFEYTFPSAAFSVEGTYKRAYFSFQKDGKRDTTGDFKIIVKGNADIDAEEAETIITEYNKLVKKLNEAYNDALNKMNEDYDEVVARIESIKTEMNALQAQIDKTVSDTEGRIAKIAEDSESQINTVAQTVTDAMNAALDELRSADFYTQGEADEKFLAKVDASITYATKADTYTKQETDNLLSLKADLEDVYTKNQSDEKYISKEDFNDSLTKAVGFGTGSDYTVSSSGVVVIPITTSYIDDEMFSIDSNKITVKKSGLVAINLSWLIDSKSSSSSWINGELYKNSTPWARINHEVKMRQPGAISNLVLVKSGDTFHFQTNSDNSGYIVRQLRAYILFIKDINEVT